MRHNECHKAGKVGHIIGMVFFGILMAIAMGLVFGYLVVYLWNWLMPSIFGLVKITYWQGFGLIVLAKILFGGFGHGHGGHPKHPHHFREQARQNWEDGTWKLKGGWRNWDYYDDWWNAEGKAAFEGYIEKRHEEKSPESE